MYVVKDLTQKTLSKTTVEILETNTDLKRTFRNIIIVSFTKAQKLRLKKPSKKCY